MRVPLLTTHWRSLLLALLSGGATTASFAPFNLWPVGILAVAALAFALRGASRWTAVAVTFCFGIGLYATGVSWVFVSIHVFGNASVPFAVLLVALLIVLLATVFALPFYLYGRWLYRLPYGLLLGVPALWVVGEWIRTWLFTGFPWLFLGYAHVETWLAGWAPLTGVMGLSFAVTLTGTALYFCWQQRRQWQRCLAPVAGVALIWVGGAALQPLQWTEPFESARFGETIDVGLAQGNIPQEKKWDPDFIGPTYERYFGLTQQLWNNEWIVWPEAAVPQLYHVAKPTLDEMDAAATAHNAALITGILYDSFEERAFYNSVIGLGLASGIYHKQHLVPFGDYVPLREWFGPVLDLFGLPVSIIEPGPPNQRGLQIDNAFVTPYVCYEIVFPDLVARGAQSANVLLTISNDAWFGTSIGPVQHLQMAQMRALETGRYLIRGTNNGISALVDDKGRLLQQSDRYVMQTLEGEIKLRQGMTPFMYFGSEPIVFLMFVVIGVLIFLSRRAASRTSD